MRALDMANNPKDKAAINKNLVKARELMCAHAGLDKEM